MEERAGDRVEQVLREDPAVRARLHRARTTVAFEVTDAPGERFVLLLDRTPPQVGDAGQQTEVALELTAEQLHAYARGELVLANALLEGALAYTGPIRKFLGVEPILRAALRRASGAER
jgi:hypothetical protein